jgi:hypothetical protein
MLPLVSTPPLLSPTSLPFFYSPVSHYPYHSNTIRMESQRVLYQGEAGHTHKTNVPNVWLQYMAFASIPVMIIHTLPLPKNTMTRLWNLYLMDRLTVYQCFEINKSNYIPKKLCATLTQYRQCKTIKLLTNVNLLLYWFNWWSGQLCTNPRWYYVFLLQQEKNNALRLSQQQNEKPANNMPHVQHSL